MGAREGEKMGAETVPFNQNSFPLLPPPPADTTSQTEKERPKRRRPPSTSPATRQRRSSSDQELRVRAEGKRTSETHPMAAALSSLLSTPTCVSRVASPRDRRAEPIRIPELV